MDGGSIILCVLASLLALRVLLVLMKAHEHKVRRDVAVETAQARLTGKSSDSPVTR